MLDPLSSILPSSSACTSSLPLRLRRFLLTPSALHPDDYNLELSDSSLSAFTICQRKAENRLILGREGLRSTSAMDFGSLFHKCEAERLLHGMVEATTWKQVRLISDHFQVHPPTPDDHRTATRMTELLSKYNGLYLGDQWPERIYRHEGEKVVERPFKVGLTTIEVNGQLPYSQQLLLGQLGDNELGNAVPVRNLHILWTGIFDAILQDSNFLWVVDHKTTSMGGSFYENSFHLSSQTLGYCWAAQQILSVPITGLMLNEIICRAPAKTARATTPREEFSRQPFFYSQDRITEWYESTCHIVSDFVSSLLRGYFPLSGPKSFMSPCNQCDYHLNCQLSREQRAADLASECYRDVTRSEALTE